MNLDSLQVRLDEIRSWRKHELGIAKNLAENAERNEEPYLCRAWTLVMYAHCDKHLKEVSKKYLKYWRSNHRESYDYVTIWQALRAKDIIIRSNDKNYNLHKNPSEIDRGKLVDALESKDVFESQNFKYESLRFFVDRILQIDLDYVSYQAFCRTLKEKRDQIAHGEEIYVSRVKDCYAWHNPTISLIDDITDSVLLIASTHIA